MFLCASIVAASRRERNNVMPVGGEYCHDDHSVVSFLTLCGWTRPHPGLQLRHFSQTLFAIAFVQRTDFFSRCGIRALLANQMSDLV